mgnify:CR=1 FL=1|jgi:acyl carrier protein
MVTLEDIKSILSKSKLRRVNIDNLKEDVPLAEQGLDSLDMFNVFLNIEMQYNIKIEDNDFALLKNINDIVNFINKKLYR